ncbi:HIT-like domain-containing protein, partial [Podospora didyma]
TRVLLYTSPLSFAFTNSKPTLPGHVLVSPRRPVIRLSELSNVEAADLFVTAKRVARTLERVYLATVYTNVLNVGQSVPHAHVLLLLRQKSDLDHKLGPDAVYDHLEGDEGDLDRNLVVEAIR